jgi:uncharacterized spore protein YtfJ
MPSQWSAYSMPIVPKRKPNRRQKPQRQIRKSKIKIMATQKFQFLESLLERLRSSANVKTIYGEPIQTEGKTIIPVARIAYGLGGGYGQGKSKKNEIGSDDQPVGEGGGGGIAVTPVGVVEITPDRTSFIPLRKRKALWISAFAAGFLLGKHLNSKRKSSGPMRFLKN